MYRDNTNTSLMLASLLGNHHKTHLRNVKRWVKWCKTPWILRIVIVRPHGQHIDLTSGAQQSLSTKLFRIGRACLRPPAASARVPCWSQHPHYGLQRFSRPIRQRSGPMRYSWQYLRRVVPMPAACFRWGAYLWNFFCSMLSFLPFRSWWPARLTAYTVVYLTLKCLIMCEV